MMSGSFSESWLKLPIGDEFIYIAPRMVFSVKGIDEKRSKVLYGLHGSISTEVVDLPAADVIRAIDSLREVPESG